MTHYDKYGLASRGLAGQAIMDHCASHRRAVLHTLAVGSDETMGSFMSLKEHHDRASSLQKNFLGGGGGEGGGELISGG